MTTKTKKGNRKLNIIASSFLFGLLVTLSFIYIFFRLPLINYRNSNYGFSFKYPIGFELSEWAVTNRQDLYEIKLSNKKLDRLIDFFGRIAGYPTYIEIYLFNKNCDEALSYLIEHPLKLFFKPTPTDEMINGVKIYRLNNVADQYMHSFNRFACIEKGDKSLFIAGEPDIGKNGELLLNFQSKFIQRESKLLFKTIIKTMQLQ